MIINSVGIVGKRELSETEYKLIYDFARAVSISGRTVVTGGAPGADEAALKGAKAGGGRAELYLPFYGFNGHRNTGDNVHAWKEQLVGDYRDVIELNKNAREKLAFGIQRGFVISAMGRNAQIVENSDIIVGLPRVNIHGVPYGGTRHTMDVAVYMEKPVRDLNNPVHLASVKAFIESHPPTTE